MRGVALLLGVGVGVFAMPAAASSESYYVYADVVDVEPLIERHRVSEPVEDCTVTHYATTPTSHPRGVATILGGVIGGIVGSQFGGGHGKRALTVAGALVGASVAGLASRQRRELSEYTPRRCSTVMESRDVDEITGYRVRYRYLGREFVKRVDSDPGDRVRIQVRVDTVAGGPAA